MKVSEMTRPEKVALYCVGVLDELRGNGLIEGGRFRCSGRGRMNFKALKAEGFTPTEQEIKDCMNVITSG